MPSLHNLWLVSEERKKWKMYFLLLLGPTLLHAFMLSSAFAPDHWFLASLALTPMSFLWWMAQSIGGSVILWAIFSKNYKTLPTWCMVMLGIVFLNTVVGLLL